MVMLFDWWLAFISDLLPSITHYAILNYRDVSSLVIAYVSTITEKQTSFFFLFPNLVSWSKIILVQNEIRVDLLISKRTFVQAPISIQLIGGDENPTRVFVETDCYAERETRYFKVMIVTLLILWSLGSIIVRLCMYLVYRFQWH